VEKKEDAVGSVQNLTPLLPELERSVRSRTGQRIRELMIELRPESIVLRGKAQTYYLKQLAQQGVCDLLGQVSLENAIVVEG
jgi:hypothetical protein